MNYEMLLNEADETGVHVIESAEFESNSDGLINGNVIGLNKRLTTSAEKACVLAEELGHHYTTVGDIIDQNRLENRKQEQQARMWAYNRLIGLMGIIRAYKAGCRNIYEMAENLEVTEEFLQNALERYQHKYGQSAKIDNYMIIFEPQLAVLEIKEYL